MKILFIEDDSFVLTMYKSRLQGAGFCVESAADGFAAIELLPRIRPDAVVLDLMLPKLHGMEVLKYMRADVNLKATPVVVLSNAYMESLATRAIEAGANVGILKTQCTPTKLIRMLRGLVGKAPAAGMASPKGSDRKAPVLDAREVMAEQACRDSARSELLRQGPEEIARIRQDCLTFVKLGGSPEGLETLNSLYRRVRYLSAQAGLSGSTKVTDLTSALEAMLFEIVFQFSRATRSTLQTAAQAVDCLARLIQNGDLAPDGPNLRRKVLVVDDDQVCNYAIVKALNRANFDAVSVNEPKAGLAMLEAGPFDLVLLDINMPDLNGFQVCEALRRLPHHKRTPVIFITINGEFQNRAQGILAGGDDLITKPISPLELTVKVTIRLLQPVSSGAATPIDPEVEMAKAEERPNGSPATSADSLGVGRSANSAPPVVASAPEPQPLAEPVFAPPVFALAPLAPAGVNGFARNESNTSVVALSPSRASAMVNRGARDGHRLDGQDQMLRERAEDLHNKLREQENASGKLRRENEDLKSVSSAQIEELARLHQRLEKARTEYESLAGQLTTLKQAHDAAQTALAQLNDAQSKQGNKLESKAQALEAAQVTVAKLKEKNVAVERQLASVSESLAREAKGRAAAEGQASELAGVRNALEQELAEQKQSAEQLRHELDEKQSRLQTEVQKTLAEQGNKLESKAQALEAAQATVAKLKEKNVAVERQLASVSESLAREAKGRAVAEGQASELVGVRKSLEQKLAEQKQAEEQLRHELDGKQSRLQTEVQKTLAEQGNKLESKAQALAAAQATVAKLKEKNVAVERQLASVSESLAREAKGRAAAEGQASELAGVRNALEQELAEQKQSAEQLRHELDEKQSRLQTEVQKTLAEQGNKLQSKAQALEAAQATVAKLKDKCVIVERQSEDLSEALALETKRRTSAEGQIHELAKLGSSLKQELAQRKQAEEQLHRELDEKQVRLETEAQTLSAERSKLKAKSQALAAAEATLAKLKDQGVATEQQLNESLAQEAERRAAAESQARELTELRSSLEQELAEWKRAEERVRHELDEERTRLQAQVQTLSAERTKLKAKAQGLQVAQATVAELQGKSAAVEQELKNVSEALAQTRLQLAQEAERRAMVEGQALELAELRSSLEQQLAQRTQAETQLRHELGEAQVRLETEAQTLSAEGSKLKAKNQALAAAEATIAKLKEQGTATEQQLNESLAQEVERRAAAESQARELTELRSSLEQELAERKQAEERVRHELDEERTRLQAQVQTLSAERTKLKAKAQGLQVAQATVAELQGKSAAVEQELKNVSEALAQTRLQLAQEAERRAMVEGQALELAEVRISLEQQLAKRTQAEAQLRHELDEAQVRLQKEAQTLSAERSKLKAKSQALAAAEATLAKLKDKGVATEQQLNESLAQEAERRATAESQARELTELRSSLEQELVQRTQAEAQLRHELGEARGRLQSEAQTLSAAEATIAKLKEQGTATEQQLNESLAQEAERRAAAESQACELAELRSSLEQQLAQRTQAEARLRHELDEAQVRLQNEAQTLSAERSKLEAKRKDLEVARAMVVSLKDKCSAAERELENARTSLTQARAQMAQEAKRRAAVEGQARELAGLRSSLEQQLAQRTQSQEQLRQELGEKQIRLQSEAQTLAAERSKLKAKSQALAAAEATIAKLKEQGTATEQQWNESLAQEAERRAAAESQTRELAELRSSLEQQLAQRTQAEAQLRHELGEAQIRLQSEAQTLAAERSKLKAKSEALAAAAEATVADLENQGVATERRLSEALAQEALEKQRLAARVVEEERAKAEMARQLATARERGIVGQIAVQSLELQLQQGLAERGRLESSLQAEAAEGRRLQLQSENLRATLADLSSQLSEKTGAEAAWNLRETDLQGRLHKLQERITESGAALAVQAAEIRGTKEKAAELLLIQSALCARVQELTAAESALVKSRRAVEEELGASQRSIQDAQKELAALRYAMLDASRVSSQVSQGRVQMIQQSGAGLAQVISALLSSPLSLVQRRLANSLQGTLDGWMKDQLDSLCSNQLPVAAPDFQACGFSLAEMTEGTFQAIQQKAAAVGIEVETSNSGTIPGNVVGDSGHIGQLISLLPESLLRLPEIRRLGLQVSVEPAAPGAVGLHLQFLIAVKRAAGEMCERLTTIAAASGRLQTAQLGDAESGLAVCWQLAQALGGTVHFDASSDQDVRLQVVLPVEISSASGVCEPAAAPRPQAAVGQN